MDSKIYENIGIVLGLAAVTIMPYIRDYYKARKVAKAFIPTLKSNSLIDSVLTEIYARLDAGRAVTVDYSNGNSSLKGLPFLYASISAEACNVGVAPMMNDFQRIPTQGFQNMLIALDASPIGYVVTRANTSDSSTVRIQEAYGIKTSINFRLGVRITDGILSIQWLTEQEVNLSFEDLEYIWSCIYRINRIRDTIYKH